jgi:hypothetical protein
MRDVAVEYLADQLATLHAAQAVLEALPLDTDDTAAAIAVHAATADVLAAAELIVKRQRAWFALLH